MFEEEGFHALEEAPLVRGDVAFVGAMGWYDYSFRDLPGVPDSAYTTKKYLKLGAGWSDGVYARWDHLSDLEVTQWQVDRLRSGLEAVVDARTVITVIHHLLQQRLLIHPRWIVPKRWRYLNVFLGAQQLGDLLDVTPTTWYCGDEESCVSDIAWFSRNAGAETHAVGGKEANAWGLYDMSGNVWEWCWDWYRRYGDVLVDPRGANGGTFRVLRGGAWNFSVLNTRSAHRYYDLAGDRNAYIGFRLVRSVP